MVEYGLEVGEYYTGNYENPEWQRLLNESDAKWARFNIWIGFLPGDSDIIAGHRSQITVLHNLGFKVIGIFGKDLFENYAPNFTLDEWRNYVRRAMEVLGDVLDAVEIWNEPDYEGFLQGYMDGSIQHYFEMLKAAYEEIKAVNPNVKVVAGSLMTLREGGTGPDGMWGGTLLKGIWTLGAGNYCDVVSIHTYDFWLKGLGISQADAVEMAYAITGKPIWVTEMSATVGEPITQRAQADWMLLAFDSLESARPRPAVVIWYRFRSDIQGIINNDFTKRLSFDIFREFATRPTPTPPIIPKGYLKVKAYQNSTEVASPVEVVGVGTYVTPFSLELDPRTYELNAVYDTQELSQTATILDAQTTTVEFKFSISPEPPPEQSPPETEPVTPIFPRLRERLYPIAPRPFDRFDGWRGEKGLIFMQGKRVKRRG